MSHEVGECNICFAELSDNCCTLPCGHVADMDCMLRWLAIQSVCPVCKVSASPKDVIRLFARPPVAETCLKKLMDRCVELTEQLNEMKMRCQLQDRLLDKFKNDDEKKRRKRRLRAFVESL
ncbi:zinc finger domain containing protein [Elysia marginata]|uniref:Zinc finger domain containing protein n=1 Tax=Elysia marginata TaxID=1093978 RepID=A0AAV4GYL6_9GAST|nr:zinc finger domain containing protein [Elysia marginata]